MGESQPAGHRLRRFGGALACALVLASCGGGGDDAATASGAARGGATTAGAPGAAPALKTALPAAGTWGPRIVLPLVPASAANLPDGKVLLWSADDRFNFSGNG